MTITAQRPALWSAMPGWGIAADLTPRELRNARQLKVLRMLMVAGLAILLLAGAVGYYLAARENTSASADLAAATDRTVELQLVGRDFADVVAIQHSIDLAQNQISQVMGADVDLFGLIGELQNNLPEGMIIGDVSIAISTAGVAGAAGVTTDTGLVPSGLPRIGTITMNATGQVLDDAADYVDRLRTGTGLVDVVSIANDNTGSEARFTITAGLTNALQSHRFDVGAG
ncbi:MAG: hypothetical protein ABWZ02_08385 [Nakamurella sp.]